MPKETMKVAYTGHRPQKLGGFALNNEIWYGVADFIDRINTRMMDKYEIIGNTGGALGVDQQAARDLYMKGMKFNIFAPCHNQEGIWPAATRKTYSIMVGLAEEMHYTYKGDYPGAWCMQKRNEQMVDASDVLVAVWDGTRGGTHNCVKYAMEKGVHVYCYNPKTHEEGWKLAYEQMDALHNGSNN